jgi:hypothetical protein
VPDFITIDFLRNGTDQAPYYTAGGLGTTPVPAKAGSSAVFCTHPRVRIIASGMTSGEVIRGVLYIQRQHSIEV